MEPGGAAERRTSVTKPIATVNLRQENIIWLETWRPIRTDCKNGAEMISGDVATFGASTKSANGWKRRTTATHDSFFAPRSETHDGTTAFFEVDTANTDVYAYDMDSLDNSHTPAMARLPTCLYTPCQIYVSTSKSRNGTTAD